MTGIPADEAPNGRGAAAVLAAAIGCAALGVLALAGDAIPAVGRRLAFWKPTGPLSGVTTAAIVVWLATWWLLSLRWRGQSLSMGVIGAASAVLVLVGLLLTFPPFMDLLQGK